MDSVHHLSSSQKAGLAFLVLFGLLTVAVGTLQVRNTIYNPFAPEPITQTDEDALATLFANDQVRLQSIDTDQDGLNDFEELTYYETSPYIQDTDSDGISDKDEILAGEDPLCPKGENCSLATNVANTSSTIPIGLQIDTSLDAFLPEQAATADVQTLTKDPEALRELLRQTGELTEAQINGFSDEDLLDLAGTVYSQTSQQ